MLLGGAGNDTLAGGVGNDTLTGGGGDNAFFITDGFAGGSITITDFDGQDTMGLYDYGSTPASMALQTASTNDGNVTLTLSDNTTITFLSVGSVSNGNGHVFSS